jgi:DNA-directed RNA polymerase subunit RPC12/RpoP
MKILVIILFVGLLIWMIIDYKKMNNELMLCPNCKQRIKQKFPWQHDNKSISISYKVGQKFNVTIYKCQNCGFGWNHTYEYTENSA